MDVFLALVPSWKATTRYSGITIDIDSYNKLPRKLLCVFPLPLSKSLMSRWENTLPFWGLLGPSGTLKYPYATFQLLFQPRLSEMCSDTYHCTENRAENDREFLIQITTCLSGLFLVTPKFLSQHQGPNVVHVVWTYMAAWLSPLGTSIQIQENNNKCTTGKRRSRKSMISADAEINKKFQISWDYLLHAW